MYKFDVSKIRWVRNTFVYRNSEIEKISFLVTTFLRYFEYFSEVAVKRDFESAISKLESDFDRIERSFKFDNRNSEIEEILISRDKVFHLLRLFDTFGIFQNCLVKRDFKALIRNRNAILLNRGDYKFHDNCTNSMVQKCIEIQRLKVLIFFSLQHSFKRSISFRINVQRHFKALIWNCNAISSSRQEYTFNNNCTNCDHDCVNLIIQRNSKIDTFCLWFAISTDLEVPRIVVLIIVEFLQLSLNLSNYSRSDEMASRFRISTSHLSLCLRLNDRFLHSRPSVAREKLSRQSVDKTGERGGKGAIEILILLWYHPRGAGVKILSRPRGLLAAFYLFNDPAIRCN